ncbi:MAG: ABC transporter permease subunit [Actinomycetota bacterium]
MVPTGRIARVGLITGAVSIYLALVGIIERFADLDLAAGAITLTRVVIVVLPLLAGYLATAPRIESGTVVTASGPAAYGSGAAAGAVSGGVLAAFTLIVQALGVERLRAIFVTASPALFDALSLGREGAVGPLLLVVVAAVAGVAGAAIRLAPERVRRAIVLGTAVTLLMGLLQRIVPIALQEIRLQSAWLYVPSGGLTLVGAVLVFAATVGIDLGWRTRGGRARDLMSSEADAGRRARLIVLGVAVGLAIVAPLILGSVISEVLGTVMVYALLGLGLNIVVGYAGLLDLGYVAFYAFGAYSMSILSGALLNTTSGVSKAPLLSLHLNFWVAIVVVALVAACIGLLIGAPVLRLRGDYLAIVTLGLGEIVSILATSKWAEPLVGGPQGMRGVTKAQFLGLNPQDVPQHFYYLALLFVVFAFFVSRRLANSRIGRAWNAMREDEQVADAMGINTTRFKLLAFAIGGSIGSLGGALFAVSLGSVTPASFEVLVSITALAVVILGGLGSLPGVVTGALVLIGLPGLLREFEEYRLLIYGGTLVAIMLLRPQGLIPNVRRTRELREEERSQDAWAKASEDRPESRPEILGEIVAGGRLGAETGEDIQ